MRRDRKFKKKERRELFLNKVPKGSRGEGGADNPGYSGTRNPRRPESVYSERNMNMSEAKWDKKE